MIIDNLQFFLPEKTDFSNFQNIVSFFSLTFFQPARLPDPPLSHIRVGRQTIHVPKCSSTLGIAIEGGANTKQPLPRIISIQPNGAAFQAGGLRIGQLIREVDGISLEGKHILEIREEQMWAMEKSTLLGIGRVYRLAFIQMICCFTAHSRQTIDYDNSVTPLTTDS